MKIHHFDLCTMCPFGGRLVNGGAGPIFAAAEMVAHALLIETAKDGLVLVDTGVGMEAIRRPAHHLSRVFMAMTRPQLREEDSAIRRVEKLGYSARDVRHIVVTHLDIDHAGGLADFPEATVHLHRREHAAAMSPANFNERGRYRKAQFAHEPKWELHEESGDVWKGLESVRAVSDDILLVPLHGHSRGHAAVAVKNGDTWLMHCGDAYFFHGELAEPVTCPPALLAFQRILAVDDVQRRANADRLRAFARDKASEVELFSAHDPVELARYLRS